MIKTFSAMLTASNNLNSDPLETRWTYMLENSRLGLIDWAVFCFRMSEPNSPKWSETENNNTVSIYGASFLNNLETCI